MTEVIQVKPRITNRGLGAYKLVQIILKEEGRILSFHEVLERTDYNIDTVRKALKELVRDCLISHRKITPVIDKKIRGMASYEYYIIAKEGLELVVPFRKSGADKRSYVSKIIPNYENRSMILELNKIYPNEEPTTYEVKWIKTPLDEKMTFQVSTYAMDRDKNNKLKKTGLSLNVFIKDEEGEYSNRSSIKVYFKEEN